MWRVLSLAIAFLLVPVVVRSAPLALAPVFQDAMVLQRGVPVPVWGTADAGTPVTVTMADQRKQTKADDKGKWSVTLDAMKTDAESRDLTVVAASTFLMTLPRK